MPMCDNLCSTPHSPRDLPSKTGDRQALPPLEKSEPGHCCTQRRSAATKLVLIRQTSSLPPFAVYAFFKQTTVPAP
jgi:hypothetical protein